MTTDARDARSLPEEGFHEIQLSGKQLVFLFMATTVVSVVIFLCGVLVGRGVRPGADASRTALSSTADVASGDVAGVAAPVLPAPPPAAQPAPGTPARMEAPTASSDKDLVTPDLPPESVDPVDSEPVKSEPPATAAEAQPKTDIRAASSASATDAWIVQVTALKKRAEAQAVAKRLVDRGYKAFVLDPQPGTTPFYRVRVGPFTDKADAETTMKRLTAEEQFKPWISR